MLVPAATPMFIMGAVAQEAIPNDRRAKYPVVLLSHGTGGSASSLGWLARRVAAEGFIVIGVDHHGNTASEPYRAEGFLCWWERPRDLALALNALAETGPFAGRLDLDRVSAAGFSLGGYAVLSLAGAITDMKLFFEWSAGQRVGNGPREFPRLSDHIAPLLRNSSIFRDSWESQSVSNLDQRIKKVIALAPAPPVRAFTPESLQDIGTPVALIVGDSDTEAPPESCSVWLNQHLRQSSLNFLGQDVGHYTLLCEGTDDGKRSEPVIFIDAQGVDRPTVHRKAVDITISAISAFKS